MNKQEEAIKQISRALLLQSMLNEKILDAIKDLQERTVTLNNKASEDFEQNTDNFMKMQHQIEGIKRFIDHQGFDSQAYVPMPIIEKHKKAPAEPEEKPDLEEDEIVKMFKEIFNL